MKKLISFGRVAKAVPNNLLKSEADREREMHMDSGESYLFCEVKERKG